MSSRLDDLANKLGIKDWSMGFVDGQAVEINPREQFKAEIKSLMLELINENSSSWDAITNLKSLKKAVEEL